METTYSAVLRTTPKHTCHDASHQANKDISQDSITRRDFVPYPDQRARPARKTIGGAPRIHTSHPSHVFLIRHLHLRKKLPEPIFFFGAYNRDPTLPYSTLPSVTAHSHLSSPTLLSTSPINKISLLPSFLFPSS
jgi:hypothetical protein